MFDDSLVQWNASAGQNHTMRFYKCRKEHFYCLEHSSNQFDWVPGATRSSHVGIQYNIMGGEDGWKCQGGRSGDNGERNRSTKLISVALMKAAAAGWLPTRES